MSGVPYVCRCGHCQLSSILLDDDHNYKRYRMAVGLCTFKWREGCLHQSGCSSHETSNHVHTQRAVDVDAHSQRCRYDEQIMTVGETNMDIIAWSNTGPAATSGECTVRLSIRHTFNTNATTKTTQVMSTGQGRVLAEDCFLFLRHGPIPQPHGLGAYLCSQHAIKILFIGVPGGGGGMVVGVGVYLQAGVETEGVQRGTRVFTRNLFVCFHHTLYVQQQ